MKQAIWGNGKIKIRGPRCAECEEHLRHHWIKIRLIGDPSKKTNRDAIGARIVATNDEGLYLAREIQGGSRYLSQNPKEQHFGLGPSKRVDLTIHWPNGDVARLANLPVNRRHVIQQGKEAAPVPP